MVFRNGTIFDIFENEKINADTLLEGMFGQTAGISENTLTRKSNFISNTDKNKSVIPVSYTHLTLPTTPYV